MLIFDLSNSASKYASLFHLFEGRQPELRSRIDIYFMFCDLIESENVIIKQETKETNEILEHFIYECIANIFTHSTRQISGLFVDNPLRYLSIERIGNELILKATNNGSSLPQKWFNTTNPLSIEEEKDAVVNCFRKYGTTSYKMSRGLGLFRICRYTSNCEGQLRVWTGNCMVERDFALKHLEEKDEKGIELENISQSSEFFQGVKIEVRVNLVYFDTV